MKLSSFARKHLAIALLFCLTLSGAQPLLAQTAQPQTASFIEPRLSEKLASPKRDDFAHLADYWLENYAGRSLNQPVEEQMLAKIQAQLLPAMISGPKEAIPAPTRRLSLLKDLQMLSYPGKRSVISGLDSTITHAGRYTFFTMLSTESTNWQALQERQRFIKLLIDSPNLLHDIQNHLRTIKSFEARSLEALYHAEQLRAEKEASRLAMMQSGIFGMIALGIRTFFEKTIFKVDSANTFFTAVGTTLTLVAIPFFGLFSVGCAAAAVGGYFYASAKQAFLENAITQILNYQGIKSLALKLIPLMVVGTLMMPTWALTLYAGFYGYLAYYFYNKLTARNATLRASFETTQALAQTYQQSKALSEVLASHDETRNLFPELLHDTDSSWNSLAIRLDSASFTADKEYWLLGSHHGRAENALELVNECHDEIGQLRRFYGEIDAYASMAQFYLDHQATTNNFCENIHCCMAEFIENSPESILHTTNFWHPIIPTDRVRPSSLFLGGPSHAARDLVVTGPNAGGKSVNLKALIVNILLAQTFGFACAESFTFTPFTKVIARLKSVDDTSGDKSKFMLEATEMAGLLKEMMSLQPTEHAFIETDELFTGTEVGPAISLSIELCARIAKMKNVMYILATHYKQLTDLPYITNNVFDNYRVSVFKEPDSHKLTYPYSLSRGIGNTNVAFDIFLEQLESQGIQDQTLIEVITKAKARQEKIEASL